MKQLVIIAGSPNCGKTITANLTIEKLINDGFTPQNVMNNFWKRRDKRGNKTYGGDVTLKKGEREIVVISFGDIVSDIEHAFGKFDLDSVDTVVCCSHATRGKKVFNHFHGVIGTLDIENAKILPIYKNLISRHGRDDQENEQLAEIIYEWIK